jgi:hypothetical protein
MVALKANLPPTSAKTSAWWPGNMVAGAIGGVVGAPVLQFLIPALRGIDVGPIIGQVIVAVVSGAALTVIAGAMRSWRLRGR